MEEETRVRTYQSQRLMYHTNTLGGLFEHVSEICQWHLLYFTVVNSRTSGLWTALFSAVFSGLTDYLMSD